MADAGRPLQLSQAAKDALAQTSAAETAKILAERQQWARKMRLIFSPRDMITEDGTLRTDYFKPKQQRVIVRKWTNVERAKLIKAIEKHGIGNWTQIRSEFLPAWEIGELRIKTQRLMGRQSLAEYIEAQWKGDETMIEMEYARNKKIGLSLNHWKGGVLVNDENGVVKQRLETEPLEPEYAAYLTWKASVPTTAEPIMVDPVSQRVSVWFADVKQYFSGLVTGRGSAEGKYLIRWDSSQDGDPDDEVDLRLEDKTLSTNNNERWCFESELQTHTRRPMKAHFGSVVDLQGKLPLTSPIALQPVHPSPKQQRRKKISSSKSKFSRNYNSDSEDY